MCVAMSIVYGILHDLITTQICLEYFTVFHPDIFHTENPFLLALGWGVIATWWVGLFLGLLVAGAARIGDLRRLSWRELLRPLVVVMLCSYAAAIVAGAFAALTMPKISRVFSPEGSKMEVLSHYSQAVQHRIMIDFFAHNASYFASAAGAVLLCAWIISRRSKLGIAGSAISDRNV